MPTPTIQTLPDLMRARLDYELRTGSNACAVILPAANRFARGQPHSVLGLSAAFDATLQPFQVLFFNDPRHFARYRSQIPTP